MREIDREEARRHLAAQLRELPLAAGGCAMCGLVLAPDRWAPQVASSDEAVVVVDQYPRRVGHLLVVLRDHEEDLGLLPWPRYAALQHLAWQAAQALTAALSPRRVWVAAFGAPQQRATTFPHLHVHVVPIYDGDERDRPAEVFSFERVLRYEGQEAADLALRLRRAWPR